MRSIALSLLAVVLATGLEPSAQAPVTSTQIAGLSQPVEIIRDGSRLEADTMHVTENGKVIVFERQVRMEIDPKKARSAPQGDRADASN